MLKKSLSSKSTLTPSRVNSLYNFSAYSSLFLSSVFAIIYIEYGVILTGKDIPTKSDISINDIVNILKKFEVLRENKFSIEDIILQNAKLTNVHEEE